jgi:nicotinamidase-related amidase
MIADKGLAGHCERWPLLVLADLDRRSLAASARAKRTTVWAVVRQCKIALLHARTHAIPVALTRRIDAPSGAADSSDAAWITGFEPQKLDRIFERVGGSFYSNPYFAEIAASCGGRVFVAGLTAEEDLRLTRQHAVRHGHAVTLLSDACLVGDARHTRPASAIAPPEAPHHPSVTTFWTGQERRH